LTTAHAYRELSDEDLLEGLRAGREELFTELYDRFFPRVYAFTSTRLRNRADAEEVVQDVFTAVFRSLPAFRGDSRLLTWIFGIARNTINNHVRRVLNAEQRLASLEADQIHPADSLTSTTPEERLELNRCVGVIEEQLGGLAAWQLDVFRLRHEEDLPIREISARTQRSGDAVRSSLYRVKRMLVEAVGTEGAGCAEAHTGGWSAA
jgi:RNA polymerase sigma factor (sigma-70 family)